MIALAEIAVVVLICSLGFYAATRQPGGLCDLGSPPQTVLVGQDRAWPPCPRFGPAAWRAERRGAHQLEGGRLGARSIHDCARIRIKTA